MAQIQPPMYGPQLHPYAAHSSPTVYPNPQPVAALLPPAYPYPAPAPAPAPAPVMQQSQQTVVVSQPPATNVFINNVDNRPNHILHFLITCICPWWIFVWCIMCCMYGC